MSASREKKQRQDRVASGTLDPKAVRAAEEKTQQRKSNILYISIAVAFVVVAAVLLVWNSGVLQRSKTAVTVGEESYSAAEVSYYYHVALNNVRNSNYASYMGISSSTVLTQDTLSDTAKLILGVTDEGDITWDTYLKDSAESNLKSLQSLLAAAKEDGFTWNDDMQSDYNDSIDNVKSYAKQYGYSYKAYLKLLFGNNITPSVFERMLKDATLASAYQTSYKDSLSYTDSDLDAYYNENSDSFRVAAYDYIYFKGTASSTTDSSGKTVEPTEEESAAAAAAAKEAAEAALARVQSGENLEDIAKDYDMATYSSQTAATNNGDTLGTWAFEEGRQADDTALLSSDSNYYVVLFHSVGRQEYNTVDVRHILFRVDTSSLDRSASDYDAKVEELKAQKKAAAEDALQQWKDGGATEEFFAQMADKLSDDSPKGGLYTQVYKNQMVTAFNDWCFDPARQVGDCEIVETSYGYHIIYFVGEDLPYWKVQVTNALKNNAYSEWYNGLQQDYEVTEQSGMKYVG